MDNDPVVELIESAHHLLRIHAFGEALETIGQAIEAHGSARVSGHVISFDFRGRHYTSKREGGKFQYERIFTDTLGDRYRDVLTNEGFYREQNQVELYGRIERFLRTHMPAGPESGTQVAASP